MNLKLLMKKYGLALVLVMSLVLLSACGEGATTPANNESPVSASQGESEQNDQGSNEAETPSTGDADKELFVTVVSEANNLDSFSATMTADQKIDMDGNVMDTKTTSEMDVTMKPELAFKQLTIVEAAGQKQEIESYMLSDGFFVKEATSGQWMKLPTDMMDQILQGVDEASLDPSAQLAKLVDFSESFSVEEQDGIYVFTLNAKGEEFNNLLTEQLGDEFAQLGDFEVNAAEYVIEVEKSSNKLLKMDVFTDMNISAEGQKLSIVSTVTTEYSNHNAIDAIEVPEEALSAEEIAL
ncbi:DUF6612 family protein [Paenibacillus septentrionalis]|uniref:DUF6612 family protein n=1 Tax=Paenibacillus septentrionalis TaxID=429342 RepID=A0ABW1V5Q5_9BACL